MVIFASRLLLSSPTSDISTVWPLAFSWFPISSIAGRMTFVRTRLNSMEKASSSDSCRSFASLDFANFCSNVSMMDFKCASFSSFISPSPSPAMASRGQVPRGLMVSGEIIEWTLPTVHSMISPDTISPRGTCPREAIAGEGDGEMKEENEAHLKSIMETFEQKLAKSKDAKDRQESEDDAFSMEFKRVRTKVIRPAMEDIGNQLKARGHTVEISEVGDERSKRDAKMTMRVTIGGIPSSAYTTENTVLVSF